MKRLHIHVSVESIEASVKFYTTMFGAEPVKVKSDYAKWLLDDPRVNFAISSRSAKTGVDHLGIQVDEDSELSEVRERLNKANVQTFDEGETTCCYAEADKTWVVDPAGLAWEAYKVMGNVEMFGTERREPEASACCAPSVEKPKASLKETVNANKTGCCG